jgi:hypothetical protein
MEVSKSSFYAGTVLYLASACLSLSLLSLSLALTEWPALSLSASPPLEVL